MTGFTAYTRATRWLYTKLTTPPIAGVLDVYEDQAPEGITTKESVWIEFELVTDGQDVAEVGEQRIWTEFPFAVRALIRGRDTIALEDIADEIDSRLHRASGTTSDGQVISSVRTQEAAPPYIAEGVEYRGLEATYNLIVQPL